MGPHSSKSWLTLCSSENPWIDRPTHDREDAPDMSEILPPRSAPPQGKLRKFSPIDLAARTGTPVRKKGFWAGWGGIVTTILMSGTLVALLVGWVALWIDRPGGPSITLLVLGCIGFSAVIIGMTSNRDW